MGFSREEYWGGLPCPPPGDLPNPGIKPRSPALQADYLLSEQADFFIVWATREAQESLLQGNFLTQELNQSLLHCRQTLYQLSYEESLSLLGTSSQLEVLDNCSFSWQMLLFFFFLYFGVWGRKTRLTAPYENLPRWEWRRKAWKNSHVPITVYSPHFFSVGVERELSLSWSELLRTFPSPLWLVPVCFIIFLFLSHHLPCPGLSNSKVPSTLHFPETRLNFWFVNEILSCPQGYYAFPSFNTAFGYFNADSEGRGRSAYAQSDIQTGHSHTFKKL